MKYKTNKSTFVDCPPLTKLHNYLFYFFLQCLLMPVWWISFTNVSSFPRSHPGTAAGALAAEILKGVGF